MDLNLQTQKLAHLLAKPATVTHEDVAMLNSLVKLYPYYKPLYLLLAKAEVNQQNHANAFAKAALYNGGELLHKVVYQPEKLATKNLTLVSSGIRADVEEQTQIETEKNIENQRNIVIADEQETLEEIEEVDQNVLPLKEKEIQQIIEAKTTENFEIQNNDAITDEQETFEEIVELNTAAFAAPENIEPKTETAPDEMAIENIVATDFFAFEKSFTTDQDRNELQKTNVPHIEEYSQEAEAQTISKYNDEKLPFSFLWWLDKTRKEHAQIFQPYVSTRRHENNANATELQQQYVEHIFHLQTPFNLAEEAKKGPLNTHTSKKGDSIIESFIKNEPQIKPPRPELANNENKAKKSAEDQNDLVSETLASIYIEQMLYQKAIAIYEKLSLKFPEKSRYFANLIKSLEKKI